MVIGITGLSGSGKSELCRAFKEEFGGHIIDADKIGHECHVVGSTTYKRIVKMFGEIILCGDVINRRMLGEIVFNVPTALKTLSDITIPYIKTTISEQLKNYSSEDLVFIDGTLLVEYGLSSLCDQVWYVRSFQSARMRRIMLRDNITAQQACSRLQKQAELQDKEAVYDLNIWNSQNDFPDFTRAINKVIDHLGRQGVV
jgi:dephospho-CoA kinase